MSVLPLLYLEKTLTLQAEHLAVLIMNHLQPAALDLTLNRAASVMLCHEKKFQRADSFTFVLEGCCSFWTHPQLDLSPVGCISGLTHPQLDTSLVRCQPGWTQPELGCVV